jgi:hypothetical protein
VYVVSSWRAGPRIPLPRCLIDHQVPMTGCDSWRCGPVQPNDPDETFPLPGTFNAHDGLVVLEKLCLALLAEAGVNQLLSSCPTHRARPPVGGRAPGRYRRIPCPSTMT